MSSILLRISNERGAVPNVAAPPPIHDGKQRRPYRLSGPVSSSPSSLHVVNKIFFIVTYLELNMSDIVIV